MKRSRVGFGATAVALAVFASGCSSSETVDGGDGGGIGPDGGEGCIPSDAGYCGVCHVMTACGEYPPGPYGMEGGMVLPPCFTGLGAWNPNGVWLYDGGNPHFPANEPLFEDLYCSSLATPHQTYGLIQVVITPEQFGRMQATAFSQCVDGPSEHWLASGGQVMQIIEQGVNGMAPENSDLGAWAQNFGTNYSLGGDDSQSLLSIMDATHGFPVTYMVNLKTMQVLKAHSYGGDFGQIQADFTYLLDSGIVY